MPISVNTFNALLRLPPLILFATWPIALELRLGELQLLFLLKHAKPNDNNSKLYTRDHGRRYLLWLAGICHRSSRRSFIAYLRVLIKFRLGKLIDFGRIICYHSIPVSQPWVTGYVLRMMTRWLGIARKSRNWYKLVFMCFKAIQLQYNSNDIQGSPAVRDDTPYSADT